MEKPVNPQDMYSFRRIMIGLDFSEMDEKLISYTAFLSYYIRPEKIYFANVVDDLDVPDEIRARFGALDTPRDETLREEMEKEVRAHFPDWESYDVEFDVVEGSPRKELLRWNHIKNIDLLIVGRKKEDHGSGLLPQQLARKVGSSVLFVPQDVKMGLNELLVPVDFSEPSRLALEEAVALASFHPDETHVYCQHIYRVPYGYSKTGKSEAEFADIMLEHAKERYEKYVKEFPTEGVTLKPIYSYDHDRRSPAGLINQEAHDRKVDMILIGARGRTAITALFLGSVAEKLCMIDNDIPLMIVKRKDKSMGILDMIEAL